MQNKLSVSAFILIGLVNIASSITLLYLISSVGGVFESLMEVLSFFESTVSQYSTYVTIGYLFAILQLITGVVTLSTGISMLTKQKTSL